MHGNAAVFWDLFFRRRASKTTHVSRVLFLQSAFQYSKYYFYKECFMKDRQKLFMIIKKMIKIFVPYGVLWVHRKLKSRPHPYLARDYHNICAIDFSITNKCNFKCEYCSSGQHNSKPVSASDAAIDHFIKLLPQIRKNSFVKLIGGEAIVHPRFFELAKEVLKNKHTLALHTNFSIPNKKFEEVIDLVPENVQIKMHVSLHLSQIRSLDDFLNKIIDFSLYGKDKLDLIVCSVLKEDNFEILKNVHEKLNEQGIPFTFQRLVVDNCISSYSQQIEDYLKTLASDEMLLHEKMSRLKTYGLLCKTGYNMWHFLPDGSVQRCFNHHKILFDLGNLESTVYTLKKPLPCLRKNCTCAFPIVRGMLTDEYDNNLAKKIERTYSGVLL